MNRPNNKDIAIMNQELADSFRDAANAFLESPKSYFYFHGTVEQYTGNKYHDKIVQEVQKSGWGIDNITFHSYDDNTDLAMLCLFIACAIETGD